MINNFCRRKKNCTYRREKEEYKEAENIMAGRNAKKWGTKGSIRSK